MKRLKGNRILITVFNKAFRVLTVLFVMALFSVKPALAQTSEATGNGFRITPVRSELVIPKGKSQTITITVENPSEEPVTARPIINNFVANEDESGVPKLILDENVAPPSRDFKSLVQPLEDFQVSSSQKVDVKVVISVPNNAKSGGYYGAVRFVPLLPGSSGRNVALTASVGTIVLVEVPGDLHQKLDLVQLSPTQNGTPRAFMVGGQPSILTRLKNSGDVHVRPFGKVLIKNIFGKIVYEYEFNNTDPRANILPDSIRKFNDDIPKKGLFGRYTVQANLSFVDGGGELISANASFYYFPVIGFYAMIIALLALAFLLYWLINKYVKRRKKSK